MKSNYEDLMPSKGLADFLHKRIEDSTLVIRRRNKNEEYHSFSIIDENIKLPQISIYLDLFYQQKGFSLSPLSTSVLANFSLKTYNHLSGSSSQAMIARERNEFYFFVVDNETEHQRKIRTLLQDSNK